MSRLHVAGSGDIEYEKARAEADAREAERGTRRDPELLKRRVFQVTTGTRPLKGLRGTWGRRRYARTGVITHLHGAP